MSINDDKKGYNHTFDVFIENTSHSSSLSKKKKIIIGGVIGGSVTTLIIILCVALSGKKEPTQPDTPTPQPIPVEIKKMEEYYSDITNKTLSLINKYNTTGDIAYIFNFPNKDGVISFENEVTKYYNTTTNLLPVNYSLGVYINAKDNYKKIDNERKQYYNETNQTILYNYVYGPTLKEDEYMEGQSLLNTEVKVNLTEWQEATIAFNIKHYISGNGNSGILFGFGSTQYKKPGFLVWVSWGQIYFKCGVDSGSSYTYADSVRIGYNESDPEKRNLTYRPLNDKKWHSFAVSVRKMTDEDRKYINDSDTWVNKAELYIDLSFCYANE